MRTPVEVEPLLVFVNTVDLEGGGDRLDDWLDERGVEATPAALRRATAVREALRTLLAAHNGIAVETGGAATVLADASRRARLELRVDDRAPRLVAGAGGVDGAIGAVLAIAAAAASDDSWSRLKACRADTCRWAYFDEARNRSRRWCSMAVCGNRTKARSFRARAAAS